MTRLEFARSEIEFARGYTIGLLESLPDDDWYRMPDGALTHVAWQIGHLAWAQRRLILARVGGDDDDAEGLVPKSFAARFGKSSMPRPQDGDSPGVRELREVFERVHTRALEVVAALPDSALDEPSEPPHPAFRDKFGALLWSARHELVHAGQIALLRRELGHAPLR